MFGLGTQELIIILVIALLIFGPKKLPELARSTGKQSTSFVKHPQESLMRKKKKRKKKTKKKGRK